MGIAWPSRARRASGEKRTGGSESRREHLLRFLIETGKVSCSCFESRAAVRVLTAATAISKEIAHLVAAKGAATGLFEPGGMAFSEAETVSQSEVHIATATFLCGSLEAACHSVPRKGRYLGIFETSKGEISFETQKECSLSRLQSTTRTKLLLLLK